MVSGKKDSVGEICDCITVSVCFSRKLYPFHFLFHCSASHNIIAILLPTPIPFLISDLFRLFKTASLASSVRFEHLPMMFSVLQDVEGAKPSSYQLLIFYFLVANLKVVVGGLDWCSFAPVTTEVPEISELKSHSSLFNSASLRRSSQTLTTGIYSTCEDAEGPQRHSPY
jgi:hypothetical protein